MALWYRSHQLTATSTQINKADYVYNPVGNRTSLTDRRGNQAFGYDQMDRLTSASHPLLLDPQAFAYDAVGNRTTGGSVVNQGNQLTADANFAYQYDDNGNLTRKTLLATGNYTQYTYDAENRLTQVQEFAADNPTAITTSSYRYDGLGRRIEKVANGQTKRYIYDGEDIFLEYDGVNVLQARYTHGPGIDEPIAVTKGGSTFFYHQDGLGSVTDLTDSAGATAKSYSYDAYGTIVDQTGTVDQPYSYTGRELDSETGLYYYRARYYDTQIGKFTQRDPIGRVGGNNYYEYALGDPTLHFDPFGLKAQVVIWAPVGIGTSSFGHVSTNINGTTYSFGPNGMTNEPTPVFDQRNSFRSSLGLDLNLTVEQEKALDECLKRDQPEYNFLTNNCGAPVQRCLNWMGYDIGQVLTPAQLYESMTGVGLVGGTIFYPGAATKPVQSK